jgi:hypothetical protein
MADYCGDGVTHTEPETPVDIFDFYGFNRAAGARDLVDFAEAENLGPLDFVLETVTDPDGSVAHHEERYGYANQILSCTNGNQPPLYPIQEDMWGAAHFLAQQNASQWNKGPYIAVRSDPTYWLNPGYTLNEGLMCPDWGASFGFCPL